MSSAVAIANPSGAHLARLVLGVFKLRIGVMIMITALAGLAVTPGPSLTTVQCLVLAVSVLL
jgi:protoheme IX farnesyltransferase